MTKAKKTNAKKVDGVFYEYMPLATLDLPARDISLPHMEGRGIQRKMLRNAAIVAGLLAIELAVFFLLLRAAERLG